MDRARRAHYGVASALLPLLGACALLDEPRWPSRGEPSTARDRAVARADFSSMPARGAPENVSDVPEPLLPADERRIQRQPICIAAPEWYSGTLGEVVLYRHQRVGDELHVGYFVYWTNERPWGANGLTYALVPAIAIDVAYSHFLFVLPGLRQAVHGAGDVEGALIVYDVGANGELSPKRGFADDGFHDEVELSRSDLVMTDGSVALLTDVWSHQLGGRGAARYAERTDANVRCFSDDTLQPLSAEIARAFRLGDAQKPRRARPAWRLAPVPRR